MLNTWLKTKAKSFCIDTSANFAIVAAVSAPVLFGSIAIAIESTEMWRQQSSLQNALDLAALATGKQLSTSTDESILKPYAKNYFLANLDANIDPNKITFGFHYGSEGNSTQNRVKLTAYYDYPEHVVKFLNNDDISMLVTSEVAAGNKTIEVAIVMDNSGSMGSYTGNTNKTRLQNAQEAARDLTEKLYGLAEISNKPDPVKISVVPFGASVNIGKGSRGKNWMDMKGWSSIHHENIAWEATQYRGDDWTNLTPKTLGYKGPPNASNNTNNVLESKKWLTRWTLFDALDTEWEGCAEMRPFPHHTQDTTPDSLTPDTLFVPLFAPDEPERHYGSYNEDGHYKNNYLYDYRRVSQSSSDIYLSNGKYYLNTYMNGLGYNYSNYTRQYWRGNWAMKYNPLAKHTSSSNSRKAKAFGSSAGSNYGTYGPNFGCTTDPLQTLTKNKTKVLDSINAMDAGGYTNVQAGISWGWRTLSSNKPFTGGRAYDTLENDKYIIVLTDGNNTMPSQSTYNETMYSAWGYGADDRVQEGINSNQTNVGAMNIHTATTCENIKAIQDADNEAAYKIFTIAYDVPNGSSVKSLLYGCASTKPDGTKYYYDVSGDALASAMASIGDEISDLRISR